MSAHSSPFIERLQQILNDPFNSEIIRFDEPNRRIQILNKKNLENILSKYFRHARFSSFVRQLNWYGFYKINSKKNIYYAHPDLQKGYKIWTIKSRRTLAQDKRKQENSLNMKNKIDYVEKQEKENQGEEKNCQRFMKLTEPQQFPHPFALLDSQIAPLSLSPLASQAVVPTCKYIFFYF